MARIVFDLDGTLIDSARDIRGMANEALALEGAPPLSVEETREFVGNGLAVFVEKMLAARDIPDTRQVPIETLMTKRYETAYTLTEIYPGVTDALDTLSRDHRLGICTNKLKTPCDAVLAHLKLDRYFDSVWGGDNPLGRKPDPAPLHATFEELGDGVCIYVGDSEVDAETAVRAGVPFLLYTEGYRDTPVDQIPHTAHFTHFDALPGLVEAELSKDA